MKDLKRRVVTMEERFSRNGILTIEIYSPISFLLSIKEAGNLKYFDDVKNNMILNKMY